MRLILGDCLDVMPTLTENSFDSIVCDPPYGLGFMGKAWDHSVPGIPFWEAALRVAKPGAYLLAFGGTRTFHRMACAIEDSGWELRDTLMWVYGSGFPKNKKLAPGIGTALKPAWEPIIMVRKPFKGSVTQNYADHGTGGINIDACRVASEDKPVPFGNPTQAEGWRLNKHETDWKPSDIGRWPANLVHDGSSEVVELFPRKAGAFAPVRGTEASEVTNNIYGQRKRVHAAFHGDSGSAARFFYCAKASPDDRHEGLEGMRVFRAGERAGGRAEGSAGLGTAYAGTRTEGQNIHPTVKPTELMRWLCRLVTPPGGHVLDPFMGSGSTGRAASADGFDFTGIEIDPDYMAIAESRIQIVQPGFSL